jgi:hypothetical protein
MSIYNSFSNGLPGLQLEFRNPRLIEPSRVSTSRNSLEAAALPPFASSIAGIQHKTEPSSPLNLVSELIGDQPDCAHVDHKL